MIRIGSSTFQVSHPLTLSFIAGFLRGSPRSSGGPVHTLAAPNMALRQFARQSARSLGLRSDVSLAPALATRGMSTVIEGLKYMASHEWAKVDGDTVTVGITDHAQVRKTKHSTQGAPQATETTGEGGWAITRAIGIVV